MNDVFKEQLVKKLPSTKDKLIKVGVIALVIIISLAAMMFQVSSTFAPIIMAALIFGAYYLLGMLKIEYEYVFTNGELDIDCIYAKSRRKRVFSATLKDVELMAHVEDKNHIRAFDGALETKDYSSGPVKENTYAFMYTYKGKRTKFIIEPNDMMLQAFQTVLPPRKLIKKQ